MKNYIPSGSASKFKTTAFHKPRLKIQLRIAGATVIFPSCPIMQKKNPVLKYNK